MSATGLRVLVVDDLEEMRIIIQRALSARGYQVDVAATLAEARGMDPGGYDAVLIDARLGPERGLDLVDTLLAEDSTAAGRCLVMTGGEVGALPDGVAYLAKPFQLDMLIDAVRALLAAGTIPAPGQPARTVPDHGADAQASVRPGQKQPGQKQPADGQPQVSQLLGLTRCVRARERHELVDFLHDGPVQELTAATLELQMMSRSAPDAPRFASVLQRLDAAAGALRWLIDGHWPFLVPETQLSGALQARTAWLLAAPVTVETEDQPARLHAAEIPLIVDAVELMLLGILPDYLPALAHVAVRTGEHVIRIELTLRAAAGDDGPIGDPATARAALDGLARALGASAHTILRDQCWQAQLVLRKEHPAAGEHPAKGQFGQL